MKWTVAPAAFNARASSYSHLHTVLPPVRPVGLRRDFGSLDVVHQKDNSINQCPKRQRKKSWVHFVSNGSYTGPGKRTSYILITYHVTYQVRPHLFQRILRNMWGRRARRTSQSMKKPIESLLIILRPFLNAWMLVESITCCGKLFHRSMTPSEKKKRLKMLCPQAMSLFRWINIIEVRLLNQYLQIIDWIFIIRERL